MSSQVWQSGQAFVPNSPGAPKSFAPGTIRFVPKSQWAKDGQSKSCTVCKKAKFGMRTRRHHCRLCGQVCCGDCTTRRHPKYPDTRICTPCYSMIMIGENSLQQAGWYHGALKRPLSEVRLMQPGTRYGDFMVRESGSVDGYIALSVRADNKVLHYLIHEKFGKFFIGNEPTPDQMYPSIQNLITENKAKYNLLRAMIVESFKGEACPQCSATVNEEMEFCEECGTRLRSTKEQIQLYEDQGQQELTYEDDGDGGGGGVYDDNEGGDEGGGVYDDDDFTPPIPQGAAPPQQWQQQQPQVAQQPQQPVPQVQPWQQQQPQQPVPQVQPWQPPQPQQAVPQNQPWQQQQPQQPVAQVQPWQQQQPQPVPQVQPWQPPQQQWQSPVAAPAPAYKFCPSCGSKEHADAGFCGQCGTKM